VLKPNCWTTPKKSQGGNCVEVFLDPDTATVRVRDSKEPAAAELSFLLSEWTAFVGSAKDGESDIAV